MTDIDDLRGLQARQQMLMAELQHRTRNLLAVVQAIASQTMRNSNSMADFDQEFEGRLPRSAEFRACWPNPTSTISTCTIWSKQS